MNKKIKIFNIKKNNQNYLYKLIKTYPNINSGRKNYKEQYDRVLKNILLSQSYEYTSKNNLNFLKKFSLINNNKFLSIKFKLN